jgi:hypothetical protein
MGCPITKTQNIIKASTYRLSENNGNKRKYEFEKLNESSFSQATRKLYQEKKENNLNFIEKKSNLLKDTNESNKKNYLISINAEYTERSFLSEINLARQNCKSYSYKITNLKKKIEFDNIEKENFLIINDKKVIITIGINKFDEANKSLTDLFNNLENKLKILKSYELIDELKIPFPNVNNNNNNYNELDINRNINRNININNQINFNDKNYLNSYVDFLKKKFEGKFIIVDYFYEICYNDPEIFTFLNTIGEYDYDNVEENFKNENNKMINLLFNEEIKYISINHKKLNNELCLIYMVFAK